MIHPRKPSPRAYFLLAEGNYPFPSTYIPSAVGHGGTLPAWPLRVACGHLDEDFGLQLEGSLEELNYTVTLPKKVKNPRVHRHFPRKNMEKHWTNMEKYGKNKKCWVEKLNMSQPFYGKWGVWWNCPKQ